MYCNSGLQILRIMPLRSIKTHIIKPDLSSNGCLFYNIVVSRLSIHYQIICSLLVIFAHFSSEWSCGQLCSLFCRFLLAFYPIGVCLALSEKKLLNGTLKGKLSAGTFVELLKVLPSTLKGFSRLLNWRTF